MFFIFIFLVLCLSSGCGLITYDRQTLLNLRSFHSFRADPCWSVGSANLPQLDSSCGFSYLPLPSLHKKRYRKRGRRSGRRVRLRAFLRARITDHVHVNLDTPSFFPSSRDCLDAKLLTCRWIYPADHQASARSATRFPTRIWITSRRRGVCRSNLCTLGRASRGDLVPWPRMALLNVRSLVNKTFVLNDLFSTSGLDVLFLTETWIRPGELIPFSELLPLDCAFFSSPRLSGRGGGLASVFKNLYNVRQLSSPNFASFEVQLLEMTASTTTLCVLVYRPPKYIKCFISDFADFLGSVLFKYDSVLILGDFNIHICCKDDLLAKDFLALMDSFNLLQWVNEPTHVKGHILDLVFTYGLDICIKDINDAGTSDHFLISFDIGLSAAGLQPGALSRPLRVLSSEAVSKFAVSFLDLAPIIPECCSVRSSDGYADTLLSLFSSTSDLAVPDDCSLCSVDGCC